MASSDGSLTITQIVAVLVIVGIVVTVSLVGCGACSLGSGGLPERERIELDRLAAVEELKKNGATVEERKYPGFGDAWSVNLSGATITDETFDRLEESSPVSELILAGSTVNDAHAERISSLRVGSTLRKLDLSKTEFTDAGLAQLKNLTVLAELNVTGTKVTKAATDKFQKDRNENPSTLPWARRVTIKR